jgi:hypothetical protein
MAEVCTSPFDPDFDPNRYACCGQIHACICPCTKVSTDATLEEAYRRVVECFLELCDEEWFQGYYIRRVRFADQPEHIVRFADQAVWKTREDFKRVHEDISAGKRVDADTLNMLHSICDAEMQLQRWPEFKGKLGTMDELITCIQNLVNEIAAKKRRESTHGEATAEDADM